MSARTLPGNPEISVKLRKNRRARRITLRVSQLDGVVTLTVPHGVSEGEAMRFAAEKQDWIETCLSQHEKSAQVAPGMSITVAGQPVDLVRGTGKRLQVAGATIAMPDIADHGRKQLQVWLKEQARVELTRASDLYAARLGRAYSRLTLRDTRSRWGSCSSAGALMYSWRLILAPKPVLDYVAAHEVAHLEEMNHSPAFWAIVNDLYGPHREARGWLRSHGASLHRYRFDG
ncbi:M48 family metallopeptidase [Marivita hallyeonensis]|uniref:YgjP-like metallopeptidase domain-containing protein n=1 Tax=Marivita hallyeonensis TaxID=996342 RepID=A0A1M5MEC4_9RHOB|nr:SprT family zinc-dependent metalloprotease [Marivita hallyeonensis]SHG75063.1 hypothetical protein SAMN05443551_0472 [Marivita hallyeonensis]